MSKFQVEKGHLALRFYDGDSWTLSIGKHCLKNRKYHLSTSLPFKGFSVATEHFLTTFL